MAKRGACGKELVADAQRFCDEECGNVFMKSLKHGILGAPGRTTAEGRRKRGRADAEELPTPMLAQLEGWVRGYNCWARPFGTRPPAEYRASLELTPICRGLWRADHVAGTRDST
jgi:hypothetical protein